MVDGNFPWTLVRVYTDADVVGTVASAHVGTALPNSLAVEYHSYELPWWADLVEETVIEDGYIESAEEPGLGVTLDLDTVEAHMVSGETLFDPA
jgi:gluconate/galactonate dehydratase